MTWACTHRWAMEDIQDSPMVRLPSIFLRLLCRIISSNCDREAVPQFSLAERSLEYFILLLFLPFLGLKSQLSLSLSLRFFFLFSRFFTSRQSMMWHQKLSHHLTLFPFSFSLLTFLFSFAFSYWHQEMGKSKIAASPLEKGA